MIRFVLLIALTTLCVPSESCRLGWQEFNGFCFGFFDEQVPWFLAAAGCQEYSARLVTIDSQRKNDWIVSQLAGKKISYWTGASSRLHNPTFEWVSTQKLLNYQNWQPGEPNNSGKKEECLELRIYHFLWNDIPCSTNNGFICERRDDSAPE